MERDDNTKSIAKLSHIYELAAIAQPTNTTETMCDSISFTFGTPKHGWLPVVFNYKEFHLEFGASDVLNDPIEELFNLVTKIRDNEIRRITWWLEPAAYFFDFEKKGHGFTLTIFETDNLHNESAENTLLVTITGNNKEIIKPLHTALRLFCSQTYEETQWLYRLDENQKGKL